MTDLYTKLIKPYLPTEWVAWLQQYAEPLNVLTPFVVFGIVFLAILYTHYEVDKQITRNPEIPKKLRELYVTGEQFTKYDLQNESEFAEWKERTNAWYRGTLDWINENMSEAAGSRFKDTYKYQNALRVIHPDAVNEEHFRLVHAANQSRNNLHDLIENSAWDQKDRKAK